MDKYIFKLQRKVAEILEQRLELLSHSNIWELADAIENHITGILDFLLYDLLKNELNSFKKINDSSLEFSINGIDFTINTVFDAKDISNLIVCITPIQHNCDHIFSEQQTVDIISFGKIKKITFIFSNKIEIDRDEILKYLKVASETIYNWVLLRLKSSISDQVIVTNAITNKLQFFLGINNELLKNIWFFVIKNGKGFYIFSQANIDFGLSKMDELLKVKKESSVRLLSEMINLIIPYETTLSVIPLSNDEPYDFIDWPDQAKYS
ncbi:MAG: hypothetical protein MUF12_05980, partial [Sediminibacterium sp.]|nr:hypothetical protein [Sediminibacterium sp.]